MQSLLQQKADVNAAQADGATAIQWAAYRDDLEMADMLIAAGANIKLANREGATPLYLARIAWQRADDREAPEGRRGSESTGPGRRDAADAGLAHRQSGCDQGAAGSHADVNAKDKLRGTTALMWATEQSHPEAVKLLVEHGADVGAQTEIDTRNARNNLANTVKQRLHSSFGVFGKRGPGNDGTPPLPDDAAAPKTTRTRA